MKILGLFAAAVVCGACTCGGSSAGPGNKGCVTQGVGCGASAQCCSGLVCATNGTCQPDPTSGCAPSMARCSNQCVVTVNDPKNCGGCGIACASTEVCTRGACSPPSACVGGTIACGGSCVDTRTDNLHCGACPGVACPAGKGCSAGACVDVIPTTGSAASCPAGGTPVYVSNPGGTYCTGSLAQVSFRWALCTCNDVKIATGNFITDAFDSALASRDAGLGASVGANTQYSGETFFDVAGYVWSGGSFALSNTASPNSRVRQDLKSNGQASGTGSAIVDHDAYINGDVQTKLSIAGKLYVPPTAVVGPNVTATGGVDKSGPVVVPPPCDCEGKLIDVAGIVGDGSLRNDNTLIGLDAAVFEKTTTSARLDLPCGRYYLTKILPKAALTIAVHGRTAIFVGGDIDTQQANLDIAIDPQAELDIFVGGTIVNATGLRWGNVDVPAQLRVYVAGSPVDFSAPSTTAGNFYLASSEFVSPSNFNLFGSLFAKKFTGQGQIHYDRGILNAGAICEATRPPGDGGTPDAGTPRSCTSCRDCANQACVNGTCGACATSADCCAPLQCLNGACGVRLN